MKTVTITSNDVKRDWYHIDAKELPLGRLASRISQLLQGKHKPGYSTHLDTGDYIVVTNAHLISLSGNKMDTKSYFSHSTRPGSGKFTSVPQAMETDPGYPVKAAVKGMLPKNPRGRGMFLKLFVYGTEKHPHEAQNPQPLTID